MCGILACVFAVAVGVHLLRCNDCDTQPIATNAATSSTTTTTGGAEQAAPSTALSVGAAVLLTPGEQPTTTVPADSPDEEDQTESETGQEDGQEGGEKGGEESGGEGTTTTEPSGGTGTTAETTTTESLPPQPPVAGDEIYVDPENGQDTNSGASAEQALKSLQRALDRVRPGQTVLLMSGTYDEVRTPGEIHYFLGRSGRADAWIAIEAAPGHQPKITPNNGTALHIQGNYVRVSGLTIQGHSFNASNPWGVGISCAGVHHVKFVGNYVADMGSSGISLNGCSNYQVLGNTVVGNAYWSEVAGSGISAFQSADAGFGPDVGKYHNVIARNRAYDNSNKVPSVWSNFTAITDGNGIIIDEGNANGYTGWTLVANNLAVGNGARGIQVWESSNIDILFNTTYMNGANTAMRGGRNEYLVGGQSANVQLAHNVGWARDGLTAWNNRAGNINVISTGNFLVGSSVSSTASSTDTQLSPDQAAEILVNPTINLGTGDFRPVAGGLLDGRAGGGSGGSTSSDITGTTRSDPASPGAFDVNASRPR